jgi:hypothetical protein
MNHEQSAWAVIASPTRDAAGIQKEAGIIGEGLGKAVSWMKGGKSFGQRVADFTGSYQAARRASMTPVEAARVVAAKKAARKAARDAAAGGAPTPPKPGTGSGGKATATATAEPGMFDNLLESGSTFVKNNPGTAALGTAALGFLGHQARNAYKAYNSPMGRMARYARKNPMVAGAGLLGAGMVAKGALSRDA